MKNQCGLSACLLIPMLILSIVFFPLIQYIWGIESIYDHQRVANISFLTIGAILLLSNKNLQSRWLTLWKMFPAYTRYLLLYMLSVGIIITVFSPFPVWGMIEIGQFAMFFVWILLIAAVVSESPDYFRKLFLISVAGFSALFIFQTGFSLFQSLIQLYPEIPRPDTFIGAFSFSYIRFFNQVQTITLPLLGVVFVFSANKNKYAGLIAFLILYGWWVIVFLSGARGTLLSVVVATFFISFMLYQFKWKFFYAHLSSGTMAFLTYILFFYSREIEGTGRAVTRSGMGRWDFWERTIYGILEKPLFGYGPMQSSIHGLELHGHNYFLTTAYEWGILSALILTGIFIFSLLKFFKKINDEDQGDYDSFKKTFNAGLLISLIAALIHSLFSDLYKTPIAQIWLVLIIGYAVGIYYKDNLSAKTLTNGYNWKLSAFLVITITFFLYSVFPSLSSYKDRQKEYVENFDPRVLRPRFWQQGKIGWSDMEKHQKVLEEYEIEDE